MTWVYLLLGAPLAALAIGFFVFHRRWPRQTHWPMLASCAAATAASWVLAFKVLHGYSLDETLFWWIPPHFALPSWWFGAHIDGLGASVLAMVTLVASLIHVYAVGYMQDDPGFSRFFLYFHLFFLMMVGFLVSNNYLQMYLFWEGMGLASYLLIGFWREKPSAVAAAWKAFLTNRIGDVGFLLAVIMMLKAGSTSFDFVSTLAARAPSWAGKMALLLFWAACAKSAQFPLYVWLPDAMEGPTPVSALMHAATMVAAGVFLMARSWPILSHAPQVAALVTLVGAATALFAAVLAATRADLKRILAYSTISQLGLMMMAVGLGNVFGAVFLLITHGFFKALLFLCAGNLIHALGEGKTSASVAEVGALAGPMKATFAAFLVGAWALSGFWPFAGFYSKDLILASAFAFNPLLGALSLLITAGSSFYIFRMLWLSFMGQRPEQSPPSHAHEPGLWMLLPVLALALLSAGAGAAEPALRHMLGESVSHGLSRQLVLGALVAAACGAAASYGLCMLRPSFDWEWRRAKPGLESLLDEDLGWQMVAGRIAGLGAACARLAARLDLRALDAFVESAADSCLGLGEGFSGLSRGLLNEYLWWMLAGAAAFACAWLWL